MVSRIPANLKLLKNKHAFYYIVDKSKHFVDLGNDFSMGSKIVLLSRKNVSPIIFYQGLSINNVEWVITLIQLVPRNIHNLNFNIGDVFIPRVCK